MSELKVSPINDLRVGFVGVGTIANAVACGIIKAELQVVGPLVVSPRGTAKVAALVEKHGDKVKVAADNQGVVDESDLVFLGIHHKLFDDVVGQLKFRADQHVVVLAAGDFEAQSKKINTCGITNDEQITRATPLPPVDRLAGTTVVFPADHGLINFVFDKLGSVVAVSDATQLKPLTAISCVMGDLYRRMETAQEFLVDNGVDRRIATNFVGSIFHTMTHDAKDESGHNDFAFRKLVEEQTPGGLNERVIGEQEAAGAYDIFRKSLEGLLG